MASNVRAHPEASAVDFLDNSVQTIYALTETFRQTPLLTIRRFGWRTHDRNA